MGLSQRYKRRMKTRACLLITSQSDVKDLLTPLSRDKYRLPL